MITKVFLTNWRSHLQSELEFSEGTNCLIGRMGSGKSSVLDAICFGLFGTFPQLQQKKVRIEDMIMKKPKMQRFAEVMISFDSNGDEYSVKRRIEKGRLTSAEFRRNVKLVETQSQKVTEEVEKILRVDYDLFTRAVYSEQNQLDMFLTIPKGQRMKKIDELLRLDRFEAARASSVSLENRFRLYREEKEKMLGTMKEEEIKTRIEMLKSDIHALEKEGKSLSSESEKIKQEKNQLKEKIAELEKYREEIYALSESLSSLEALNRQLNADISSLEKEVSAEIKNPEILKQRISVLKDDLRNISVEVRKARDAFLIKKLEAGMEADRLSQLENVKIEKERLETVCFALEKTRSELKTVSEEFEKNAVVLGSLKTELSSYEAAIKGLAYADSCPVCNQKLSEEKKGNLVLESKEKMENLKTRIDEAENQMKKLALEKKRLEPLLSELEAAEIKRKGIGNPEPDIEKIKLKTEMLSKEIEEMEKNMQKLENNAISIQGELETLIQEYEAAKTAEAKRMELEKKRMILESKNSEIKALKTKIGKVRELFSAEEMKKLSENMESLIGSEKSIETRIISIGEIISEKQKRLEEAVAREKIAEGCRLEIRKSAAMEQQLQLLERGLEVTQQQLRKDFIGAINLSMHRIWESLYPYTDFSSVRIAVEGDYVLQLHDMNGWVSVENVSGGERSIACLALRIAFALVLAPQLRWLVLDEPTHNLDEKAVTELANVLRDNITEFVEQIFLITHDQSLEAAVSGYLYRMEKGKEGFTKVLKVGGE